MREFDFVSHFHFSINPHREFPCPDRESLYLARFAKHPSESLAAHGPTKWKFEKAVSPLWRAQHGSYKRFELD
jgi:hypothetical protein